MGSPAITQGPSRLVMFRSAASRVLLLALIFILEFAAIEGVLRVYGAFEGSSTFQSLFMDDPDVGIRLRPGAHIRYTTVEFSDGHRHQRRRVSGTTSRLGRRRRTSGGSSCSATRWCSPFRWRRPTRSAKSSNGS